MVTISVLAIMLTFSGGTDRTGWASQYDAGVMERTVALRQRWGQLPDDVSAWVGFVAVPECGRIGETVYLRPLEARRWERFLVADCAGPDGSYGWMVRNRIFVEVDGATARRWGTVGRGIRIEMMTERGTQ